MRVPELIAREHCAGRSTGSIRASVLFLDIAGFTGLVEASMALGDRGAEVMSRELRAVFDPPVEVVAAWGGMVTSFAGDAFTALFPGDGEHGAAACEAAAEILRVSGRTGIGVKCGIDRGVVEWGICRGAAGHRTCYFRGEPIDGAARQEGLAARGEMVTSWPRDEPVGPPVARVDPPAIEDQDPGLVRAFVPPEVLLLGRKPEIKPIVSVFLAFAEAGAPLRHTDICTLVAVIEEAASSCGGTLDKLGFGDKGMTMLVFFGAPRAVEYPAISALEFMLRIRERLARERPTTRLRAGLADGLAYAGITGGRRFYEWTCLGDCVNVSARLMSGAAWGEVLVTDRIEQAASKRFEMHGLGERVLEGRSRPQLTSRLERRTQRTGRRIYQHGMVSRRSELAALRRRVDEAAAGCFAGLVCVHGGVGMGKTRLLHELRRQVEESPAGGRAHVQWALLRCQQHDGGLRPLRLWLEELFGVDPFTPQGEKRARVEGHLEELCRDPAVAESTRAELRRGRSFLAALVDCRWEGSRFEEATDLRLRAENQLWTAKELVKALAARAPLVLELEDAHWLEPDTARWLRMLTRNIAEVPLLVIASSRPSDDGARLGIPVDDDVPVHELELGPLGAEAAGAMFAERVGRAAGEELLALLAERTEGNPFFLEQMIAHFTEQSLLEAGPDGMRLVPGGSGRLPATLESVLLARFDRLGAEVREGLKHAATLGVRFLRRVLLEILDRSEEFSGDAARVLPGGEREGMVQPEGLLDGEDAYLFRHVLMQKAAYDMQPPSVREYVHLLAGEVTQELFGDRPGLYGELAWHFGAAGRPGVEADYLEKAGGHAADCFRNEEAIATLGKLEERLRSLEPPDHARMARASCRLGAVLSRVGRRAEGVAAFEDGIEHARAASDSTLRIEGLCGLGNLLRELARMEDALAVLAEAQELAGQLGDTRARARPWVHLGNVHFQRGDYAAAAECFEALRSDAEELGDLDLKAVAIGSMGNVHDCWGDYQKAMACFEERLALSRQTGDRQGQAAAIGSKGIVFAHMGDLVHAIECHEEFLELSKEFGNRPHQAIAIGNLGSAWQELGDSERATEYFARRRALAEELGERAEEADR